MIRKSCFLIVALAVGLSFGPAFAKDFNVNGPLISRTQNPVYLQTLGQIPSRAKVNEKGQYSLWLNVSYSNLFDPGRYRNNETFLDMELARLCVDLEYGIGRDMEVGLEIPFLHFNGGYFDAFIQSFHRAFGFPNGGRERYPNGLFTYRLTRDGTILYNFRRRPMGLSDIVAVYKYNFLPEKKVLPAFTWTFKFKFPTGAENSALGSGNIDYSLGLILEKSISRIHFYLNLDYIVASCDTVYRDLCNDQMLAWLTAVEVSVSRPISIVAQLQGSTPLLAGLGTEKWDGIPLDLVMGVKGTHKNLFWKSDFFWQWSFSEDVAAGGPSADITTMLVVGLKFGGKKHY